MTTTRPTCTHCGDPLTPALRGFGTHLLCEPNPVRRHRICEWLWGRPSNHYLMPSCATSAHCRNPHREQEAMAS